MLHEVTSSGHAVENIEARAGSGKTTLAGAIAHAYRTTGYHVIGDWNRKPSRLIR